ncbi:hypothetical protein EBB07_09555 [Paenibacillaceae bacterium]|nr:hypothetical protein EBB07_09555 [Paenibacillaceae bacterium]
MNRRSTFGNGILREDNRHEPSLPEFGMETALPWWKLFSPALRKLHLGAVLRSEADGIINRQLQAFVHC